MNDTIHSKSVKEMRKAFKNTYNITMKVVSELRVAEKFYAPNDKTKALEYCESAALLFNTSLLLLSLLDDTKDWKDTWN